MTSANIDISPADRCQNETQTAPARRGHGRLLLALTALHLGRVLAGETTDEADYLNPIPVILTATHLAQPIDETPTATTVIDHETIVASGATEIADLFRLVPGFQVAHALGNQFAVTYHGHASTFPRQMQVLVDGRSVYSPLFSIVDWNHIGLSLEDIERIEVVRGSNTAINGTNAFVATINFITRQPFQDQGVYISDTHGSNESQRQVVRFAGSLGDFDQRLTLEHREDDGFDGVSDSRLLTQANYRGSYYLDERNAFDIQLGHAQGPMGLGLDKPDNPARRKDTRSHYVFLRWQHTLANDDEFYVQAYDNFLEWRDNQDIVGPLSTFLGVPSTVIPPNFNGNPDQSFQIGEFSGRSTRQDIELRYHDRIDPDLQAIWGLGVRRDRFSSPTNLDQNDAVKNDSERVFAHLEWRLAETVLLNAGSMLEHDGIGGTETSPRLAMNLHVSPDETVRLAVTRSARMPSIIEARQFGVVRFDSGDVLDFRRDSQLGLRPEHITSYEIGYTQRLPARGLNIDTKLFHDQITDVITAPTVHFYPDPDVPTAHNAEALLPYLTVEQVIALTTGKPLDEKVQVWMNAGHIDRSGLDLGVDYSPTPRTRVLFNYGYAVGKGRRLKRIDGAKTIVDTEDEQNSIPRHTLSLLLSHRPLPGLMTSLAWYHVSPMTWLGDGDPVDGHDRVDLMLRQTLPLGFADTTLALTVQNLFDDPYLEATQFNVFRRRIYLQLALQI